MITWAASVDPAITEFGAMCLGTAAVTVIVKGTDFTGLASGQITATAGSKPRKAAVARAQVIRSRVVSGPPFRSAVGMGFAGEDTTACCPGHTTFVDSTASEGPRERAGLRDDAHPGS